MKEGKSLSFYFFLILERKRGQFFSPATMSIESTLSKGFFFAQKVPANGVVTRLYKIFRKFKESHNPTSNFPQSY